MAVPGFGSLHAVSHMASMDIVQRATMGLITDFINAGNKEFTIFIFYYFVE
jgi:hypothetical protein